MTRNETLYKILFAIELALVPMVLYAHYAIVDWAMGLFVAGIFVCKVWRLAFKNKKALSHQIIDSLSNVLVLPVILIFEATLGYSYLALAIAVSVLIVLAEIFNLTLRHADMPDTIEAVDFCVAIFEFLTLLALTFVTFYDVVAKIGIFALLLASAVAVAYKLYFVCRSTDWKYLFAKIFRKK